MSTDFPGSPHGVILFESKQNQSMGIDFVESMDFVEFSCTMENWWGNPCISHMMKYTIRLVSNGKKHPYYGKSMSTNFSGSPYTMGFVVFSVVWEIDGKPMHFPNDGVCHRIGV